MSANTNNITPRTALALAELQNIPINYAPLQNKKRIDRSTKYISNYDLINQAQNNTNGNDNPNTARLEVLPTAITQGTRPKLEELEVLTLFQAQKLGSILNKPVTKGHLREALRKGDLTICVSPAYYLQRNKRDPNLYIKRTELINWLETHTTTQPPKHQDS